MENVQPRLVSLPPCPSWCVDDHENQHPVDHLCESVRRHVPVEALPLVHAGPHPPKDWRGPWVYDTLDVHASMPAFPTPMWITGNTNKTELVPMVGPRVSVYNEVMEMSLELRPEEARELASALVAMAALIESESGE